MTSPDRLIIFTRYPEPGSAKTRLIPALGSQGAADLYRQMAEHTLVQARKLRLTDSIEIEVRFAGGDQPQMQAWLGADMQYQRQSEGDLGDRMAQAFQQAFIQGCTRVVMIGTDCPELDADGLSQAFQALQQHDLVLGPASDGGYYLIGLRRFVPELFQGITWSTATVFQATVAIAEKLGLPIATLPTLIDIDYPENLEIWRTVEQRQQQAAKTLSIVIPVLNEAAQLPKTLASLKTAVNPIEVLVVDGGSQDETVEVAKAWGATVIFYEANRATQMNLGARKASGETLLFLHGDTCLPTGFDVAIQQTLSEPKIVAGAFELKINAPNWGLRLIEQGVNWRSRRLQLPYGDQALFLKADLFQQLGGFPHLPIMEDFVLVRQLQQQGQIATVPRPVLTSGRRWQKLGLVRTTVLNQLIVAAYLLGVSPDRLARWYGRKSSSSDLTAGSKARPLKYEDR